MPGTILENLSGKKLSILVIILLVFQLTCFLIGIISPSPASSQAILASVCEVQDIKQNQDLNVWWSRETCKKTINLNDETSTRNLGADNLVFMMEMPAYGNDFSRWQQNLAGIIQIDTVNHKNLKLLKESVKLTIDTRLAYSNKINGNKRTKWQYFSHSEIERNLECTIDKNDINIDGYPYNCSLVPLFELGNLHHDYYLLNLRLPYDFKLNKNTELTSRVVDVYLHIIHMNGGFTKIWISMKFIFLPIVLGILIWFYKRVHMLERVPALIEIMLLSLGVTLIILNLPIEYLTIYFNMPYMLILSDIRQGIFYAMLLSFWMVFAGEHMLIQDNGCINTLKMYWKHLSSIIICCISLFSFDLCERGIQLYNPFFSIWVTDYGTKLATFLIILAILSGLIYFSFLCYMIWSVFTNISIKRSSLPSMSQARRLHYEGIIYRFNFLMITTLICAAVTIFSFTLNQINEGGTKLDDNVDFELSSIIHTGVFGMWNVYICGMLILYAPSHKQWINTNNVPNEGEEVEFNRLPVDINNISPNEISSLTSFASKASID